MAMFQTRRWLCRSLSTLSSNPIRVCVVGSGPAGFYTAEKMLKTHKDAEDDIIDRLPTPFGLVRSGVAPDHPETKFSRVSQNVRCEFFGNVALGSSVSLKELCQCRASSGRNGQLYDVVVLAYGAESDRTLDIPGEDFLGIHSAREFVWWYNGHADGKNLNPDLRSTDTAVILGQGNVALDVARILLQSTAVLATTDIANHALEALEQSSIRRVYLVGRRGPAQAACTAKELREVLGIKDLRICITEVDLVKSPEDEEVLKNNRIQRRVHELLSKAATSGPTQSCSGQREVHFVFFRKPDRFLNSGQRRDHVAGTGSGKQIAVGTGQFEDLECGLVLKSIGYKSVPVDGLTFDHQKGVVPNIGGRVLADTSGDTRLLEQGLYVCGWLKRGPTGIIATNLYCAEETVASISQDLERGAIPTSSSSSKPGREGLLQLLESRNVRVVPFNAWEKIDAEEKRVGSTRNKPREKLTTREDLLEIARTMTSLEVEGEGRLFLLFPNEK